MTTPPVNEVVESSDSRAELRRCASTLRHHLYRYQRLFGARASKTLAEEMTAARDALDSFLLGAQVPFHAPPEYVPRLSAAAPHLTPRLVLVARLIAHGRSTKEIAADLGRSVKTIETQRLALMRRIGVNDVAGVVRFALRSGLVE